VRAVIVIEVHGLPVTEARRVRGHIFKVFRHAPFKDLIRISVIDSDTRNECGALEPFLRLIAAHAHTEDTVAILQKYISDMDLQVVKEVPTYEGSGYDAGSHCRAEGWAAPSEEEIAAGLRS